MFYSSICNNGKYDNLTDKFNIAFQFLQRSDLANLSVGSISLDNGLVAQVQEYETNSPLDGYFESHDKHFDIQFVVSGEEIIEIANRDALTIAIPYNSKSDATLYQLPERYSSIILEAGQFALIAPEEAHKPRCYINVSNMVKKIVIKIPL